MDPNNLPPGFCVLPWIHTAINPNGDVTPCCMTKHGFSYGNLNATPLLKDIFNSDNAKRLRKEMLESPQLPDECFKCRIKETVLENVPKLTGDTIIAGSWNTRVSFRHQMNNKYRNFIKTLEPVADGSTEFRQLYIDYRFSNKCNFKCITCGPTLSSSHALEYKKLSMKKVHGLEDWSKSSALIEVDHDSMFKQFKEFSHEIRVIYFAGGEPLINDHHYDILQHIIDTQQPIEIYYNTNFSELRYRKHNLLDMWRRVNGRIGVFASIDGYGPEGETIRYGFDTKVFEDNVNTLIAAKLSNVDLRFSITFGIANYDRVIDTVEWLIGLIPDWYLENHKDFQNLGFIFNPVLQGIEFSTLFMNQKQRQNAIELVTKQFEEFEQKFKKYSQMLRLTYLDWILNIHRAAYGNEDKRRMILSRWGFMNKTDPIRQIDWKKRLPRSARHWAEIWHELDQLGIDTYINNTPVTEEKITLNEINAYIAEHRIGQP